MSAKLEKLHNGQYHALIHKPKYMDAIFVATYANGCKLVSILPNGTHTESYDFPGLETAMKSIAPLTQWKGI